MNVLDMIMVYIVPMVLGIGVVSAIVVKVRGLFVEIAEVLVEVDAALSDGSISKEEIAKIIEQSKDVWEAVKKFKK